MSLASLRHLLSQASVRSTNGCTELPTRGFVSSRRLARSFRRRNPENDFYAVPVDFDAAHEDTYDFLHADAIDNIETIGDPGREVLQAADYERKVALDLDGVERGSMPLLELGKALFQTRDARLELRLVDEACQIASNRDPLSRPILTPLAGWNPPGARQCDNQDENAPPLSLRSEGVARPRERQRRRAEKFLPLQWRGAGRAACGNWRKV